LRGSGADARRLPAITALLIQCAATAGVAALAGTCAVLDFPTLPGMAWLCLQAALAAALAWHRSMARWWIAIHLCFLPLLLLALALHLPPWLFPAGFFALMLIHGPTYRTQVPTHLSRHAAIAAAADLMPAQAGFRCLDLGCGFGGVLSALAKLRSDGRYHGVEGALLPFAISWARGRLLGYGVDWGDLWKTDLASYDVVYAYLSPACMQRLWTKALHEMRPGSLLISNGFAIPGVAPALSIAVAGRPKAMIHLWRIGEAAC
jgi:hypothetical protein